MPDSEYLITVDPATNTLYAGNLNLPQIDVINGATCHVGDLSGCAPVATIPVKDPQANIKAGSIDQATHTLYASDPFSDTTSVINTAACNATHTAGCAHAARTITIGPGPGPPVLDPATRTLYIPYGKAANRVAVVNAATCNAMHTSGCGQVPAVVTVGNGTFDLAVSVKTDTVYAPATGAPAFNGHTVAVINGATCNGTDHSGCGHLPPRPRRARSVGVAVNDRTHTVYVANNTLGDRPGTVSVINAADLQRLPHLGLRGAHAHRSHRPIGQHRRRRRHPRQHHLRHQREQRHRLGAQRRRLPGRDDPRLPPRGDHASGRLHSDRRRRQPADQNRLRHEPLPGRRLHVNLPQPPVMRSCADLR